MTQKTEEVEDFNLHSPIDRKGNCSLCGGVHYGNYHVCPYACDKCRVNTDHCEVEGCPRNRRWKIEEGMAVLPPLNVPPKEGRS